MSGSPPREEYQRALLAAACNGEPPSGVLSFAASTPTVGHGKSSAAPATAYPSLLLSLFLSPLCLFPSPPFSSASLLNYTSNSSLGSARISTSATIGSQKQEKRRVPKSEDKILDAPSLVDDYCKWPSILSVHVYVCMSVRLTGSDTLQTSMCWTGEEIIYWLLLLARASSYGTLKMAQSLSCWILMRIATSPLCHGHRREST